MGLTAVSRALPPGTACTGAGGQGSMLMRLTRHAHGMPPAPVCATHACETTMLTSPKMPCHSWLDWEYRSSRFLSFAGSSLRLRKARQPGLHDSVAVHAPGPVDLWTLLVVTGLAQQPPHQLGQRWLTQAATPQLAIAQPTRASARDEPRVGLAARLQRQLHVDDTPPRIGGAGTSLTPSFVACRCP